LYFQLVNDVIKAQHVAQRGTSVAHAPDGNLRGTRKRVDKVVFQTELFQLPAPLLEVTGESTRAVLFAHRPLTKMDKEDRVRACYLHACLKYVNREHLTNTSVRGRFGIEQQNIATASRLIKEAVDAGVIAPVDPDSAKSHRRYVPWWAVPSGMDDKGEK
jgi:predicted HTH transcriptional regulator